MCLTGPACVHDAAPGEWTMDLPRVWRSSRVRTHATKAVRDVPALSGSPTPRPDPHPGPDRVLLPALEPLPAPPQHPFPPPPGYPSPPQHPPLP